MLKNKEFKWVIGVTLVLLLVSTGVAVWWPKAAVVMLFVDIFALAGMYWGVTAYRYHKIKELSDYLHQLSDGSDAMFLKDYQEGELSYLQSEIYKMTIKLTEQAEWLKQDKNYLADAISDISHQLKTPITSMRVMADLLKSGSLSEDKRRTFTVNIQNQLNRMEWLVTALLKMAKLDADAITLKQEPFVIEDMLKNASEHLLIPMELREITFEVCGDTKAVLTGDIQWIAEAFANILKNCMEHTPAGGKIVVDAEKTVLYTQIHITDTGCGIDKEDLPYIFERFYKGKNASSDSVGIGLAMAKQIINRQNGILEVEKTSETGTVFSIKFYNRYLEK